MSEKRESVNGVIFDPSLEKILLIKRRDVPVWVLPGGGIDEGESPEKAVLREVQEETGYTVKIQRKIGEYSPLCRLARFTHVYECAIVDGKPTLGDETAGIQFFPYSSLPHRIPPPYPDWMQDAWSFSSQVLKKDITSVTYTNLIKNLIFHPLLVTRFLLTKIGIIFNSN